MEVVHLWNHVGIKNIDALQVVHMGKSVKKNYLTPIIVEEEFSPSIDDLSLKMLP